MVWTHGLFSFCQPAGSAMFLGGWIRIQVVKMTTKMYCFEVSDSCSLAVLHWGLGIRLNWSKNLNFFPPVNLAILGHQIPGSGTRAGFAWKPMRIHNTVMRTAVQSKQDFLNRVQFCWYPTYQNMIIKRNNGMMTMRMLYLIVFIFK